MVFCVFLYQNGPQMDAKMMKNRILAKVWFWVPLLYGIHGFGVQDGPKSIEKTLKKHAKQNHSKNMHFGVLGGPGKRQSLEKVGPKGSRGLPKESQGRPKPRKIVPEKVSEYVLYPKWAPTGSDCLQRRLLKGFLIHFCEFSDDFWWIFV